MKWGQTRGMKQSGSIKTGLYSIVRKQKPTINSNRASYYYALYYDYYNEHQHLGDYSIDDKAKDEASRHRKAMKLKGRK